jgi:hypothetical protein
MTRLLYRLLLALHPPAFRREFGGEMLWIFDESHAHHVALPLFADALASLARQWLFRSAIWIPIAACAGAFLPLAAGVSLGLAMKFPPHPVSRTVDLEFIELTVITALIAIFCTLILCVVWFRISRRPAKSHA